MPKVLARMKTLEIEMNKRKKRRGNGLTKRRREKIGRKKQQKYKIWPSWNDEADFRHREKYKEMQMRVRQDNDIDMYEAYDEDKR